MSSNNFLNKENVKMLWDVISDEDIFRFLTPNVQKEIYNLFLNNLKGFYNNERNASNSLVELNKKYIILILNHIKNNCSHQPSKIKIHNEYPTKESITFEEIQNDRKNKIQHDFERIQEEFDSSMSLKPPPTPKFADETDKPIKEMDKILKQIQQKRNYEIEQINKNHNPNSDSWLKPQETSLKPHREKDKEKSENYIRFKFLTELDDTLSPNNAKKVTFSNNDEINTFDEEHSNEEFQLFSKLKKVNVTPENNNQAELNEDRIAKLERNVASLNERVDKLLALLSQNKN